VNYFGLIAFQTSHARPGSDGDDEEVPVKVARVPPLLHLLALVSILSLSPAAYAGLGETVDSIARDHAALRGAALQMTPRESWDLHEITTPEGTRVREYASKAGMVFAVSWAGPVLPNLPLLLAAHYDEYATAARARHAGHRHLSISTKGLVLNITKLPRGFAGSAHLPEMLPAGTTAADLH
jgi:hypothetical protein